MLDRVTVISWDKHRMELVPLIQVGVTCDSNIVGQTQNGACTIDSSNIVDQTQNGACTINTGRCDL